MDYISVIHLSKDIKHEFNVELSLSALNGAATFHKLAELINPINIGEKETSRATIDFAKEANEALSGKQGGKHLYLLKGSEFHIFDRSNRLYWYTPIENHIGIDTRGKSLSRSSNR